MSGSSSKILFTKATARKSVIPIDESNQHKMKMVVKKNNIERKEENLKYSEASLKKLNSRNKSCDDSECEAAVMSSIKLRTTPFQFKRVIVALSPSQKEAVKSYGFGALLDFNVSSLPTKLCHYVVESFDCNDMVIKLKNGEIKADHQAVHDVFGIPMGGSKIDALKKISKYNEFLEEWSAQFSDPRKPSKKIISSRAIASKILESKEVNHFFKMNFVMLFVTSLISCVNGGRPHDNLLVRVGNDTDLRSLDWCGLVLHYLRESKRYWKPNSSNHYYCGPATFLVLLYVDRTKFDLLTVPRERPVFKNWSLNLDTRELLESKLGQFGTMEIMPPFVEDLDKIKDYENVRKKLIEISKIKEMMFLFFHDEKIKDPNDSNLKYYHQKLSEVLSMEPLFYTEESNLNREIIVYQNGGKSNNDDVNNNVVIEEQLKKKHKKDYGMNVDVDVHDIRNDWVASSSHLDNVVGVEIVKKKSKKIWYPPKFGRM